MRKLEILLKELNIDKSDLSIIEEAFGSDEEVVEYLEECKKQNIKGISVIHNLPEF